MENFLNKNLQYLNFPDILKYVDSSKIKLENTKTKPTFSINGIFFHSKYDPVVESKRLIDNLDKSNPKKLLLFFGAGLGYSVLNALEYSNIDVIWFEVEKEIIYTALSVNDFSVYLKQNRLKILLKPFNEEELFKTFKGYSNHLVSFIPHKPSFSYKEKEYLEFKYIAESFFHKKDANIATLTRFEKIWTKNLFQNMSNCFHLTEVNRLFGIAEDLPVLVCGAGPSLYNHLDEIKSLSNRFILLAVDTSLKILESAGIQVDLVYTVDPQAINTSYLEGFSSDTCLVFDPSSSYHSLRLENFPKGFLTSSPFPVFQILEKSMNSDLGKIPFGGSVSTNTISLGLLMNASEIYLAGQDLAFTNGFAHCKGAILEERVNYKESRFFRREKHNFNQLFALPKLINKSYEGKDLHTNEKMKIFLKWFEENLVDKNVFTISTEGSFISTVPFKPLHNLLSSVDSSKLDKITEVKQKIKKLAQEKLNIDKDKMYAEIDSILENLRPFVNTLEKGKMISEKIYNLVRQNKKEQIQPLLLQIDKIDEIVSSKKGLNEIIGLTVQRTVLRITEGYEMNLSLEEKKNPDLEIAKKTVLLYSGLYEGARLIFISLKKLKWRLLNAGTQ
jgi:hypothetical protein